MTVFSVQAAPRDAGSWLGLARRCEASGFAALVCADHPGSVASPFVALAAAAGVTSRLGLGSYVSNAGVREPVLLASDVATLDVVSGGRACLGLGAGHTPAEWAAVGRTRPDVGGRIRRAIEVAEAVVALLEGEDVDVETPELAAHGARLDAPRPVQPWVPLTVGGANSRLLRWAGGHADVVGLSGLGRTLADGHRHEVRWRQEDLEVQLGHVADGAASRSEGPVLEALVQHVAVTDDPELAVADLRADTGMETEELLASPFVLVGTRREILDRIEGHRRRWGISRYVVREGALDDIEELMSAT